MATRERRNPSDLVDTFRAGSADAAPTPQPKVETSSAPPAPAPVRAIRPTVKPAAASKTPQLVYAAQSDDTTRRLRAYAKHHGHSHAIVLGEAVEALAVEDLEGHLTSPPATSMPGSRPTVAGRIEAPSHHIRVKPEQHQWLIEKHKPYADRISMRQFLGIAITKFMERQDDI